MTAVKNTVLVVDDDLELADSVKAFLEARGYDVRVAHNGEEARRALRERLPDALVLDIMMEYDTEGFDLAYELQSAPATKRIPIVIVSGFSKQLDRKLQQFEFVLGRDWPAAKLFEKPVELSKLEQSLRNLIRENAAAPALPA